MTWAKVSSKTPDENYTFRESSIVRHVEAIPHTSVCMRMGGSILRPFEALRPYLDFLDPQKRRSLFRGPGDICPLSQRRLSTPRIPCIFLFYYEIRFYPEKFKRSSTIQMGTLEA